MADKGKVGAPKGNTNAKGNKGGGAPFGNQNALKHGFYANWRYRFAMDDRLEKLKKNGQLASMTRDKFRELSKDVKR